MWDRRRCLYLSAHRWPRRPTASAFLSARHRASASCWASRRYMSCISGRTQSGPDYPSSSADPLWAQCLPDSHTRQQNRCGPPSRAGRGIGRQQRWTCAAPRPSACHLPGQRRRQQGVAGRPSRDGPARQLQSIDATQPSAPPSSTPSTIPLYRESYHPPPRWGPDRLSATYHNPSDK